MFQVHDFSTWRAFIIQVYFYSACVLSEKRREIWEGEEGGGGRREIWEKREMEEK